MGGSAEWSMRAQQRTFDHLENTLLLCPVPFFLTTKKMTRVLMALISYSILYVGVQMC